MSASTLVFLNGAALHRLVNDPHGPVGSFVGLVGDRVLDEARRLCPVDTGELRASLHVRRVIGPTGPSAEVRAGSGHALYVELGTRYQRAQPFLRPALQRVAGALPQPPLR